MINTEDQLPLSVEMPSHVILEVHTQNRCKRQYSYQRDKASNCRDRCKVNVPLFINEVIRLKSKLISVLTQKG